MNFLLMAIGLTLIAKDNSTDAQRAVGSVVLSVGLIETVRDSKNGGA